eukprot:GGOE01011865.1.p1 GENE.GGOE01011865.1~~GGOE01011865.1.p1  ORF type:complete len:538 (-),score=153.84 GGOE01011865.1:2013-3446(-)
MSPLSRPLPTPIGSQSNRSMVESCQSWSPLESQVHYTLLFPELCTREASGRQAIHLERERVLREVSLMHDWFLTQQKLLWSGQQQLQQLEACRRDHLVEAEKSLRKLFCEEDESVWQAAHTNNAPEHHAVACAAMEPRLFALEATGRTANMLEEECGRQALTMYGSWHLAQSRLHLTAIHQLAMLEDAGRDNLIQAEDAAWNLLLQDAIEMPPTPQLTFSSASSIGDDFSSLMLMEEMQEPWALCEFLATSQMEESHTPLSSSPSGDWSLTPAQSLVSRQQRARMLIVHHEQNDWARLVWLRDVELSWCLNDALLQLQLMHKHLVEEIETEEEEAWSAFTELFETELLDCLKSVAKRRCGLKLCAVWENEHWTPMHGWAQSSALRRPPFSDATSERELESAMARENLRWSSEGWELDVSSSVESDGWQYALTFNTPFRPSPRPWSLVRRRKWVRACELLPASKPADATCKPSMPSTC